MDMDTDMDTVPNNATITSRGPHGAGFVTSVLRKGLGRVTDFGARLCLGVFLCICLATGALAQGGSVQIADQAELARAIAEDRTAGATLVLAPGRYGTVRFSPGDVPAAIRSANPQNPAEINAFSVDTFTGLEISDLRFKYIYAAGDRLNLRPFSFMNGQGLILRNVTFEGDLVQGTGTVDDGHPGGIGLSVRFSDDVRIEQSLFTRFHRAMAVSESSNIAISDNEITAIRMDGIVLAQVEDLMIERNLIHSFDRALDSDDHADMIQMWTASTTSPSRNITIRENVLHSGTGAFTQSIFINNELVNRGSAGEEMFYRNILIEENVIINAQLHGITVSSAIGLTVRRNTLAQNPLSAGGNRHDRVWYPSIRIAQDARDVIVEGNMSSDERGYTHTPGWQVDNNLVIHNQIMLGGTQYNTIFRGWPDGDPRLLETYRYATPMPGIGAARLGN